VLTPAQEASWARRLGVAEEQVRVDHLLSHLILGIARATLDDVVFFGGTALCRTHLLDPPWTRLSEDLDLLVVGDHTATLAAVERAVPHALRREFPGATWLAAPTQVRAPAPALIDAGGSKARVQLLPASRDWRSLADVPRESQAVALRYDDTPGTISMTVPTLSGFAAMKLLAWEDRHAPRDLFDLAGLATLDAFTDETAAIFGRLCARPPDPRRYQEVPERTRATWDDQLAHQTAVVPTLDVCLTAVAEAVGRIT
jgi:predicted nucleotidyltransferase component of viral defense system